MDVMTSTACPVHTAGAKGDVFHMVGADALVIPGVESYLAGLPAVFPMLPLDWSAVQSSTVRATPRVTAEQPTLF